MVSFTKRFYLESFTKTEFNTFLLAWTKALQLALVRGKHKSDEDERQSASNPPGFDQRQCSTA
jgi:hypothetical protein